jgi:hypothetical protein
MTSENCSRCKDQTPCMIKGVGENAKCPHNTVIRASARGVVSLAGILRRNFKHILSEQKSKIQYEGQGK